MTRCRVQVLGRFQVSVDGSAVPPAAWRTRRAADLVKVLALDQRHSMHREQVMDLLWPDLPAEAAASNLRKAIHHARGAMGAAESITAEGAVLMLWGGDLHVDVDVFMSLAAAAEVSRSTDAYRRAVRSYSGEVLPADRYEPWVIPIRERLRDQFIACLKGAGMWERVLEIDPADEDSHRALMQQHVDAGRRGEALRQFQRMRAALRDAIGVGPDRDTVALYERVLRMDGAEAPTPAQQVAQLVATRLMSLNRGDLADAEGRARQARDLAIAARLGHETGDASTLLALASSMSGRWQDVFREDVITSLEQHPAVASEMIEAHLCFVEYYMAGSASVSAEGFARELLAETPSVRSSPARGMVQLMLGESLLHAGDLATAARELARACELNCAGGTLGGLGLSLEHLAEIDISRGDGRRARARVTEGLDAARHSACGSHLTVRLLGISVAAGSTPRDAMRALDRAHRTIADMPRVCQPCSINLQAQATIASARSAQLHRARRHLATAERVAGLWQGGPMSATVWEARAAVRLAEGSPEQARALLWEAAAAFDEAGRSRDAARCRAAASSVS